MVIRTEDYIPPKKVSRSDIVNALRGLKAGKSLLITGEHLTDRTRSQVYKAASREGLEVRTQRTTVGLRVWLKDSERASIEQENDVSEGEIAETAKEGLYFAKPKSQEEAFSNLANLGLVRQQMREIDEANAPESELRVVLDE